MKNTITRNCFSLLFFLFATMVAYAQDPEQVPSDEDPLAAPINDYLWVLVLLGLLYVFYKNSVILNTKKA